MRVLVFVRIKSIITFKASLRAVHENILSMYQKISILITGFCDSGDQGNYATLYMAALFRDNPVCRYLFSVTAPAASQLAFFPATSANP